MTDLGKRKIPAALWLICLLWAFAAPTLAQSAADEPVTYPFRIVQISDTQPPPGDQARWDMIPRIVDTVNALKPAFVIFPGDITHTGTDEEFTRMRALLAGIEAPVHYVPGNHDMICGATSEEGQLSHEQLRDKRLPIYRECFGPERWSFEYGNMQFVGFDSTDHWPQLTSELRQWLMASFEASDKPYKFVVTHYTEGDTAGKALDHLLTSAGAVGILHGHDHSFRAWKDERNGRLVFSSGSAGFYGDVLYYDVYEDSMVCYYQRVDGETKPLGVFDLKRAKADVLNRKNAFEIAPYLQQLTPHSVTVKWQTKATPDASVLLRNKGDDKWSKKASPQQSVLHEVTIDQLAPQTTYELYVDADTEDFGRVKSPVVSFTTPPLQSDSLTFAVYGDNRTVTKDHRKVTSAIAENFGDQLALCLHTGDLVTNGRTFDQWATEFFGPAQELLSRVPLYPVLGNHEENSPYYFEFFNLPGNERWYSFDQGPVHFICLDSCSSIEPNSPQYVWLIEDLEKASAPWTVMSLHHPFFSSGPHGLEHPGLQQNILPLLEKYGVDIVFSGHDHLYERNKKGDIYYIVTGGGGAPVYGPSNAEHNPYSQLIAVTHHYCIVNATPDQLHLTVYDAEGRIIDDLTVPNSQQPSTTAVDDQAAVPAQASP